MKESPADDDLAESNLHGKWRCGQPFLFGNVGVRVLLHDECPSTGYEAI